MKKKRLHILAGSILLLVIAVIAASVIIIQNLKYSYVSYECYDNAPITEGDFAVSSTILRESDGSPKQWQNADGSIGTVITFMIYNNTDLDLNDWYITIELPEGSHISDEPWDCTATIDEKGLLTTHTLDYNTTLFKNSNRTLGFVLVTPGPHTMTYITVHGVTDVVIDKNKAFLFLGIATALWFAGFAIFLFDIFQDRAYRKQRAHDKELTVQAISTFTNFIDAKDPYTRGHSVRVALFSQEIARRMHMSEEKINNIYYIALLHDSGKIGIPDSVLQKPGKLTEEEFDTIKGHTLAGEQILSGLSAIPEIREGAKYHHERYDGKGYPDHLAGQDIPLCARIICVADSYDAMSSNRCYRKHLEQDVIIEELKNNAGSQFDPDLVGYMIAMIEDGFAAGVHQKFPSETEEA